jgi:hypothetical protein
MAGIKVPAPPIEPWAAEARTFELKRAQLLQRYQGQFVALYRGRVIGHGLDDEKLAMKLYERVGDVPFYIVRVERQPSVFELPSPEVVR